MIADPWAEAKQIIGGTRVLAGPQLSQQLLDAPDHLAFQLARYRAAAALIGNAQTVLEVGCGEGIGAGILAKGRQRYCGLDNDAEGVRIARETVGSDRLGFAELDILNAAFLPGTIYDAVVSLDVIEHIPAEAEGAFLLSIMTALRPHGVCVIGTPSRMFEHLASPQSKAGHVNLYTHDRLYDLLAERFQVVQSFGLQDTSLHTGHPDARHYLLMAGIGPR